MTKRDSLSEKLTPFEIKNKEFKKVVWGYSPQDVVEFLDQTAKTWERVQRHEKELIEEIRVLNEEIENWKKREPELEQLKVVASKDADGIREQAREEGRALMAEVKARAEDIRERTEEWLATVIKEVEAVEKRRDGFLKTFKESLDQQYTLLNEDASPKESLGSTLNRYLTDKESHLEQ